MGDVQREYRPPKDVDGRIGLCERAIDVLRENVKTLALRYDEEADHRVDQDQRIERTVGELDERVRNSAEALRAMVDHLALEANNDRTEAKLLSQETRSGIATTIARIESAKKDINGLQHIVEGLRVEMTELRRMKMDMEDVKRQMATKTDPGDVKAIFEHWMILAVIAICSAVPPFLIEILKQVGVLHATK